MRDRGSIARAHLIEIDSRISRLTALRAEVERMIQECTHGRVAECRVIEVLADHELTCATWLVAARSR
jgi:hypothetical protein